MKIILKKLSLLNFKGARSTEIEFSQITNVSGDNATGKTTLIDAFLWLFFGKDSTDRKDFEIKTLDEKNRPLHRLDHQVTATLDIDGDETTISRIYREKWTKKRGEPTPEFTGHETTFVWNEVPCNEKEFQAKVAAVVQENIFKLITNTSYFNNLKWQDRRNVLLGIAGNISTDDILERVVNDKNREQFKPLIAVLNGKKSLDEFKREIAGKKKAIKDELVMMPARIDEAKRSLPDDINYKAIQILVDESEASITSIDTLLMNKSKAVKEKQEQATNKQKEIYTLQQQVQQIEFTTKNSVADKKRERESAINSAKTSLRKSNDELIESQKSLNNDTAKLARIITERDGLREEINKVIASQPTIVTDIVFDEKEFCCPTCKRAYEASDIEEKKAEMLKNFNENNERLVKDFNEKKAEKTKTIRERGLKLNEEIGLVEAAINNHNSRIATINTEISGHQNNIATLEENHKRLSDNESTEVVNALANNTDYHSKKENIAAIEKEIAAIDFDSSNDELLNRKKEAQGLLSGYKEQLAGKALKEKVMARIKELTESEKTMANSLAELEGTEFSIETFVKAKMDTLVERVNGMFKLVTFKMFETQINGGTVECCECLINGVPYSDANNASKINAGIDIINTLSEYYDAYAPVFVDNAEAVNKLIPVKSQLIRLVVSKDKNLKIEAAKQLAEAV